MASSGILISQCVIKNISLKSLFQEKYEMICVYISLGVLPFPIYKEETKINLIRSTCWCTSLSLSLFPCLFLPHDIKAPSPFLLVSFDLSCCIFVSYLMRNVL